MYVYNLVQTMTAAARGCTTISDTSSYILTRCFQYKIERQGCAEEEEDGSRYVDLVLHTGKVSRY